MDARQKLHITNVRALDFVAEAKTVYIYTSLCSYAQITKKEARNQLRRNALLECTYDTAYKLFFITAYIGG